MVRGVYDGVGVDLEVAVEVGDGAGLADVFDAAGGGPVAGHGADPGEGGRVAVGDGDEGRIAGDLGH